MNDENLREKLVEFAKCLPDGLLFRGQNKRRLVNVIKCRNNLSPEINVKIGLNCQFVLQCSDVIALYLELFDVSIHKKMIAAAIEQQIPIPIQYCMMQVNYESNCGNNDEPSVGVIEYDSYIRDIIHLASQSKLLSDGMSTSQTSGDRDKPLVMFIGSNNVNGKSSMLAQLFDINGKENNDLFNVSPNSDKLKSTPLHNTSVDLVYLARSYQVNYHILDVHGKMNDKLFNACTNYKLTRIDALSRLVSLTCHCLVVEITIKDLSSSKKRQFALTSIISKKRKELKTFLNQVQVSRHVKKQKKKETAHIIPSQPIHFYCSLLVPCANILAPTFVFVNFFGCVDDRQHKSHEERARYINSKLHWSVVMLKKMIK